ncbi:hypothetical protein CSB93_4098 [Pseudomonas paraeruginosa]|uniref:Uncharacterized protein n=1 Tax=Pseudomonas paraeruginosa TaxID=2994495 RepID=A0A2R3IUA7_9PSED|nr:hypothetical protein CSB93_4098 [Pseudomonas paraeruginosa]AWE94897.1 hypothetical protein CSC28_2884 [Pseudomonas paraeruginosa]
MRVKKLSCFAKQSASFALDGERKALWRSSPLSGGKRKVSRRQANPAIPPEKRPFVGKFHANRISYNQSEYRSSRRYRPRKGLSLQACASSRAAVWHSLTVLQQRPSVNKTSIDCVSVKKESYRSFVAFPVPCSPPSINRRVRRQSPGSRPRVVVLAATLPRRPAHD